MGDPPFGLVFATAPYRLSGVVYGAALNHAASIAALGDAVDRPPYKSAPKGVVLYIKPRNTFAASGAGVEAVDDGEGESGRSDDDRPTLVAGASLGIVIGQTASGVREADALAHVAGFVVAGDFGVAHESWFRPQIPARARDRSLVVGAFAAASDVADPEALAVRVFVDGRLAQQTTTGGVVRGIARLVADISDFTTLSPGDLVLLGVAPGAPRVAAGATVAIEIDGVGRVETWVARRRSGHDGEVARP